VVGDTLGWLWVCNRSMFMSFTLDKVLKYPLVCLFKAKFEIEVERVVDKAFFKRDDCFSVAT
jgi:hypothetical protein